MKGMVWNCKRVTCKHSNSKLVDVADCLLLYLCCEANDDCRQVVEVARRVLQLNKKRYGKSGLVLFPFAHLSNSLAEPQIAQALIGDIIEQLERKIDVQILGFNQDKELSIHLLPNNQDVTYFSY